MVCEILSDSTRKNDLINKSVRYLKNGIKEYWIIDLLSKKVILRKNRNSTWLEESSNTLQSEVLVGFTFDTKEFFEED